MERLYKYRRDYTKIGVIIQISAGYLKIGINRRGDTKIGEIIKNRRGYCKNRRGYTKIGEAIQKSERLYKNRRGYTKIGKAESRRGKFRFFVIRPVYRGKIMIYMM